MERPGLTALMADIDRGKIDVVVVYKVDRLTRSLMDFAKIVDSFDRLVTLDCNDTVGFAARNLTIGSVDTPIEVV